ncbi:uncharacterized protein RHO25_004037 [Cercospora beticola]|uniref:Zn(2)-C6 fungal-type domain-containing protein n=1 Tax=Cercospora beticola TaxID=122368 RepID=A0ABZ0NIS8_CERBT|nr:hypothetical protein RHO25_004037 [Cercospora beticola]
MEDIIWINESPETRYVSQLDGSSAPPHTFRVLSRGTNVRRSCNACSRQKVRCGAERPACKRCNAKGVSCTYMPSKRRGPRNRSGKNDRRTLGRETEDGKSEKDGVQCDAVDNVEPDLSKSETPPLDQLWTSSSLPQYDADWDFTFSEHWSNQHDCSEIDALETLAGICPNNDEHASKSAPGTCDLQYDALPTPQSVILPQSLPDDLAESAEEPEKSKGTFDSALVHDPLRKDRCETLALSLLSGSLTKLSCYNAANGDNDEVQSQSPDPDRRVTHIQEALWQIEAFLDLPGSLRSDFWDLTYLIIRQTLVSYDSILKSDCPVNYCLEQDPAAGQQLSNKRAWSYSGGRYFDPKAQRLLSAYLVLMDTNGLLQPLLERLERKLDSLSERSSGSSTGCGPSWMDPRLMTLKCQHRSVQEECNRLAEAAQGVGGSIFSEQRTLAGQSKRRV